jgi:uncharacterized protein YcfJ
MYLSLRGHPSGPLHNPTSSGNEKEVLMKLRYTVSTATLGTMLFLPVLVSGQDYGLLHRVSQSEQDRQSAHDRAEREQTEKDHRKHTGAKIVGGSAAGGAVIGGLAGGGKGAIIGGAAGAGGGAIANKVRKDKAVKKREQSESYRTHQDRQYDQEPR